MNKKENSKKVKATNSNHENVSLESKVIEKSLGSKIDFDKIDSIRGIDITITTSARTNEEALALLTSFKLPIRT